MAMLGINVLWWINGGLCDNEEDFEIVVVAGQIESSIESMFNVNGNGGKDVPVSDGIAVAVDVAAATATADENGCGGGGGADGDGLNIVFLLDWFLWPRLFSGNSTAVVVDPAKDNIFVATAFLFFVFFF